MLCPIELEVLKTYIWTPDAFWQLVELYQRYPAFSLQCYPKDRRQNPVDGRELEVPKPKVCILDSKLAHLVLFQTVYCQLCEFSSCVFGRSPGSLELSIACASWWSSLSVFSFTETSTAT